MHHHRWIAFLLACGLTAITTLAAETPATAPASSNHDNLEDAASGIKKAVAAVPDVEAAIPSPVKALGPPAMMEFPGGIQIAVSAATAEAQAHVNQGLNHLHGGWEFEASRHFAAAMRDDPACLLAHWGMVMCLLNPSPETGPARNAATDRMLDLIDQGVGTDLERGYAYGLIKYIEEGPTGAAIAFRKVAERFPNEMQAGVFAALFSRGGYDDMGDATPDQQAAEKLLLGLIKKYPQSPVPLNALLLIRAEAPDLSGSLDLAQQLNQLQPAYPPVLHLLGHYEWRCGHHGLAVKAFSRAAEEYHRWMTTTKATLADCPEWTKSECYRIVALASKGDFENAYIAARKVAATPLPANRPTSAGTRMLLWEAKTLPARILLQRGLRGNAIEASLSLLKPKEVAATRKSCLAYWWIDGLRFALEAQRLLDAGDLNGAHDVCIALTQHGATMAKTQAAAAASGERSMWIRAFRALEVLASDVRGRLAMAGPADKRGPAYNWFSSATDRQRHSSMLCPPMLLTPMAARLGDYYLSTNEPNEAIEAYQRALTAFPNDPNAMDGLKRAYEAADKPAEATALAEKIAALKAE